MGYPVNKRGGYWNIKLAAWRLALYSLSVVQLADGILGAKGLLRKHAGGNHPNYVQ